MLNANHISVNRLHELGFYVTLRLILYTERYILVVRFTYTRSIHTMHSAATHVQFFHFTGTNLLIVHRLYLILCTCTGSYSFKYIILRDTLLFLVFYSLVFCCTRLMSFSGKVITLRRQWTFVIAHTRLCITVFKVSSYRCIVICKYLSTELVLPCTIIQQQNRS